MSDPKDRRAAPRFEIIAQANVVTSDETYLMVVRNVSAGGAFLEGAPGEYPELKPGAKIEVALSGSTPEMSDEEVINIRCTGQVARVETGGAGRPPGFGIILKPTEAGDKDRLAQLLQKLAATQAPL
jgi:hypothetical protein